MRNTAETDFLILGAGLAGLSAGHVLGDRAIVLEREHEPGGLVRSIQRGEYWFDFVIHSLYFADAKTRLRLLAAAGQHFEPYTPRAHIEVSNSEVPFPIQSNLWALPPDLRAECLQDFERACELAPLQSPPSNYRDQLEMNFGRALCDLFFFPYNEKMWQRPLTDLATTGFHWNIARPSIDVVRQGAAGAGAMQAYNAEALYPRPPADYPMRGMQVLSDNLAQTLPHLLLDHSVIEIDGANRCAFVSTPSGQQEFNWRNRCISTLPLPTLAELCRGIPEALRERVRALPCNRVRSIALSIEGPRRPSPDHWRYYPSPDLCFTRLIDLCEFDSQMAPPTGWALLVEVTESGATPMRSSAEIIDEVIRDVHGAGVIAEDCRIIDAHVMDIDPAYVVFTPDSAAVVADAIAYFKSIGIECVGRYARWEYSSMAQVIRDGFEVADSLTT